MSEAFQTSRDSPRTEGPLRYEAIPILSRDEMDAALRRDDPDELGIAVLSAAHYSNDPAWAESLCARLARHPHDQVRGNAILGFAHLARIHRLLTERTVRPLVDAALADPSGYVRGQAESTADDLGMFLGWNFHRPT